MSQVVVEDKLEEPQAKSANSRAAVLRLFAVIAAIVVAALVTHSMQTVLVIFAVIVMVMVHEFGHFFVAKRSGMKVTEYFLGFGPRLWSIRRGETEYGIKAIPAGGYVKIIGMSNLEDVDESDEPRTYRQQPYWQRLAVAVAGSFMHFVMAFLLLMVLFVGLGVPTTSSTIGALSGTANGASPAQQAGLQDGDKILAIDGKKIKSWNDITSKIISSPNVALTLTIRRHGQDQTIQATPAPRSSIQLTGESQTAARADQGFMGFSPKIESVRVAPLRAIGRSVIQMGSTAKQTVLAIGHIFSPAGIRADLHQLTASPAPAGSSSTSTQTDSANAQDSNRLVSPIGFVGFAHNAAKAGLAEVLILLFSINMFVGIFNLIPLLPFDGGHVAVATYEKLRSLRIGKRYFADYAKLAPVSYAVLTVYLFIGLSAMWLDIFNPIPNPFQ